MKRVIGRLKLFPTRRTRPDRSEERDTLRRSHDPLVILRPRLQSLRRHPGRGLQLRNIKRTQ